MIKTTLMTGFLFCLIMGMVCILSLDVQAQENREKLMETDSIRLTILYDNYQKEKGTKADWGFSCLIEGLDKTILFDTGADTSVLKYNMAQLNVDPSIIDVVVISHMHWDHTGGLDYILGRKNDIVLYLPASADQNMRDRFEGRVRAIQQYEHPEMIMEHVWLSGELGGSIKEQSLIIDTSEGLIVITGCSHPGIVDILRTARNIVDKEIALTAGGYHLLRMDEGAVETVISQMKKAGVKKCAASHCTGDDAIKKMKAHFAENYVPLGTGTLLSLPL